jgi:hypothetical protein
MGDVDASVLRRFWSKVDQSGDCWEWTAARNHAGYGQFRWEMLGSKSQMQQAHRVSWYLHFSDIPPELHVCHHCDNPRCVRPAHLFLGTDADNHRDSVRKGRATNPPNPQRLTPDQVEEIFSLREGGMSQPKIAERLGCSNQLVSRYLRGEIVGLAKLRLASNK